MGELLANGDAPHKHLSLFAVAFRANIPATVHVAVGTDTVHMHPQADGAAIGAASMTDFRTICEVVARMGTAGGDAGGGQAARSSVSSWVSVCMSRATLLQSSR